MTTPSECVLLLQSDGYSPGVLNPPNSGNTPWELWLLFILTLYKFFTLDKCSKFEREVQLLFLDLISKMFCQHQVQYYSFDQCSKLCLRDTISHLIAAHWHWCFIFNNYSVSQLLEIHCMTIVLEFCNFLA